MPGCCREKEAGFSAGRLPFAPFPGDMGFFSLLWGRRGAWGGLSVSEPGSAVLIGISKQLQDLALQRESQEP